MHDSRNGNNCFWIIIIVWHDFCVCIVCTVNILCWEVIIMVILSLTKLFLTNNNHFLYKTVQFNLFFFSLRCYLFVFFKARCQSERHATRRRFFSCMSSTSPASFRSLLSRYCRRDNSNMRKSHSLSIGHTTIIILFWVRWTPAIKCQHKWSLFITTITFFFVLNMLQRNYHY